MPSGRLIRTCVAVGLSIGVVSAQNSGMRSVPELYRTQADSIATELLSHLQLDPPGRVAVFVEGAGQRALVENAVLEGLARRGVTGRLTGPSGGEDTVLHLVLLDQRAEERAIGDSAVRRIVSTALEARLERPEGSVKLLGTYRRTDADTVRGSAIPMPDTPESSVFDRILVPLVMLGTAVLMAYLFFTVRS